jgi:hypothetical protein
MIRQITKLAVVGILACGFSLFGQDTNTAASPSFIPKENWKTYTSAEGGFTICFPGTPEHTNLVVKTKDGDCKILREIVPVDPGMEFSVQRSDYLGDSKQISPEQRLDTARAALVSHRSWKLEYEKDFTLGTYPGKDFIFSVGEDSRILGRMRVICGKECIYQTQVIFHTGHFRKEDVNKFLDSFSINEK